jgi:hypothetical protein
VSSWNVLLDWPPNEHVWRASIAAWFKRLSSWILIGLIAQLTGALWILGCGISSDVDMFRGFNKPVIAFELATGPEEASAILLGDDGKNRLRMQTQFYRDFFFIGSYSLTFVLLGCALFAKARRLSLANVAAGALIVLGLSAGCMDVLENIHGLAVLKHQALPAVRSGADEIRIADQMDTIGCHLYSHRLCVLARARLDSVPDHFKGDVGPPAARRLRLRSGRIQHELGTLLGILS